MKEHKDWFTWRADGSIPYAENPPKKYQDIVNVDFYASGAVPDLWNTLRDAVLFWVNEGVTLFRVDNPHTKPFPFWEWLIADVRGRRPDVVFLSEAFTRPKMMYRLAKCGFSQSYTYFTWRNHKHELQAYVEELNDGVPRECFRPHFFVNTPDINPLFLQTSGRNGHLIRAALATTLSGLWGCTRASSSAKPHRWRLARKSIWTRKNSSCAHGPNACPATSSRRSPASTNCAACIRTAVAPGHALLPGA